MTTTSQREENGGGEPARKRRMYSGQQKADLLAAFAASEVSAARFCREHRVHPATLAMWRRQAGGGGGADALVGFAQVRVAVPSTAAVTITLATGSVLSVPAGADARWVGELVRQLS